MNTCHDSGSVSEEEQQSAIGSLRDVLLMKSTFQYLATQCVIIIDKAHRHTQPILSAFFYWTELI